MNKQSIGIVICDDEPSLAFLYARILSNAGYRVSNSFKNGKELVSYVRRNPQEVDVIILDYKMPEMDGLEAAKLLRLFKPGLKIIMASAYDVPGEALEYFNAIIRKPFSISRLVETVANVV